MIDIQHVSKKIGKLSILSEISIPLEKGKLTAFIGPNGAGKSTLLSLISGKLKKNTGEIYLDGNEVKTWKETELAKKLSMLSQANHLNMSITVKELVSFGRFPYSKGRLTAFDQEKVNEAMSYLGLVDLAGHSILSLSGGQLQRAYIALVLAQDTEYILLDEPLNNLDMNHAVQMMETLQDLVQESNKTIIIVMHDINFAASYADEIVALKEGQIFIQGKTEDVIDQAVLSELFDMHLRVCEIEGKKMCMYFNQRRKEGNK